MENSSKADQWLEHLAGICLALPETVAERQGDHADFRVRKKVFAYFLNDHHGDGIVSVCVKPEGSENVERARLLPDLFYLPAYIGKRGWVGLRLDQGAIDWREVHDLVEASYRLVAPKTLLSRIHRDS